MIKLLDVKNLLVENLTLDIAFEKTVNILIAKILMKYEKNIRTNSWKHMDIIKIFTALNGFVKSCWRLFLLLTSRSWGRFRFTSISLQASLAGRESLTKLETGLQVELRMTELLALLNKQI